MLHVLKCWPAHFDAVKRGVKKVEVRKDDRGYEVGDILRLLEYNPETESYTNSDRAKEVEVTHIVRGGQFGLAEGHVAMSIKPLPNRTFEREFNMTLITIGVYIAVFALICFLYLKLSPPVPPPPCNCICEKR